MNQPHKVSHQHKRTIVEMVEKCSGSVNFFTHFKFYILLGPVCYRKLERNFLNIHYILEVYDSRDFFSRILQIYVTITIKVPRQRI